MYDCRFHFQAVWSLRHGPCLQHVVIRQQRTGKASATITTSVNPTVNNHNTSSHTNAGGRKPSYRLVKTTTATSATACAAAASTSNHASPPAAGLGSAPSHRSPKPSESAPRRCCPRWPLRSPKEWAPSPQSVPNQEKEVCTPCQRKPTPLADNPIALPKGPLSH